ncbi:hypothetical protein SAMN04489712_105432 [Thermomonospora echinospora]|uniref:C2H2-type domain-containing protein n=1 Tax=Thermomonospora echinospora TaxID=1992 RepID=A0A1H6AGM2_9ACTN|nr:hypothetical protein [Thermomonospora echinospora]SEG47651.1 hypothetical protein SAMN04489712_105432 [Thermomonospora echinospora]
MSLVVGHCRRAWRRAVRSYLLVCARDDAAARGLTVPDGVWICGRCHQALLELTSLREHLRVEHAFP